MKETKSRGFTRLEAGNETRRNKIESKREENLNRKPRKRMWEGSNLLTYTDSKSHKNE